MLTRSWLACPGPGCWAVRLLTCSQPALPAPCRTSGRRLGYVQQMFVDPDTLSVVSLYLRKAASSIGAKNGEGEMSQQPCCAGWRCAGT